MEAHRGSAAEFLERTTVRELLGVDPDVIDQARVLAHQLYRAGRLTEADVVCRGLIACDHRFAWTYSLHAAVLRRQGRLPQALAQVELGLRYAPSNAKLRAMRAELTTSPTAVAAPVQGSKAQRATGRTDSDP